jgi:hypothetical protein
MTQKSDECATSWRKTPPLIPGHGRPMRPADIEFPIRYLRELESAVRAAIDEGRSVEATLDVAAMPDYSGYSLFEWAHHTVNVPAAYRDLQERAIEELRAKLRRKDDGHN